MAQRYCRLRAGWSMSATSWANVSPKMVSRERERSHAGTAQTLSRVGQSFSSRCTLSSKSEYRNPKQIQITKFKCSQTKNCRNATVLVIWTLVLGICFGFRVSNFGFGFGSEVKLLLHDDHDAASIDMCLVAFASVGDNNDYVVSRSGRCARKDTIT